MTRVGYARVSTADQNLERQRAALAAAGCERVYVEHASGGRTDRPELAAALDYARAGDHLVVTHLDRLGRDLRHLLAIADDLRARDVQLVSLGEGIDTSTPQGQVWYAILGTFAEFQRALIHERTRAGLARARELGRLGGRRPRLTEPQVRYARRLYAAGEAVTEIAAGLTVSRATIYRALADA